MARHDFSDRHIFITGASSGLGKALAIELARSGAKVGLVARREVELTQVLDEVVAAGSTGAIYPADVTDFAAMEAAVMTLEQELGPVYGVIANAGVDGQSRKGVLSVENARRCLAVNVDGVIHTIAAVQPGMLERGEGMIATVSSLAAYRGLPASAPYSASKAAVSALTESLRVDLRPQGIDVTTIHPGFVRTPLTAGAKHPQPFIIDADQAARIMVRKLKRGAREINFPWQLATIMAVVRRLPNVLFDGLLGGRGS
jgi:short-subunit dehydrogenase